MVEAALAGEVCPVSEVVSLVGPWSLDQLLRAAHGHAHRGVHSMEAWLRGRGYKWRGRGVACVEWKDACHPCTCVDPAPHHMQVTSIPIGDRVGEVCSADILMYEVAGRHHPVFLKTDNLSTEVTGGVLGLEGTDRGAVLAARTGAHALLALLVRICAPPQAAGGPGHDGHAVAPPPPSARCPPPRPFQVRPLGGQRGPPVGLAEG